MDIHKSSSKCQPTTVGRKRLTFRRSPARAESSRSSPLAVRGVWRRRLKNKDQHRHMRIRHQRRVDGEEAEARVACVHVSYGSRKAVLIPEAEKGKKPWGRKGFPGGGRVALAVSMVFGEFALFGEFARCENIYVNKSNDSVCAAETKRPLLSRATY